MSEVGANSPVLAELPGGVKVKQRTARMRACSERDAKGKMCAGHLKRWFAAPADVRARFGEEVYRCEKCRTIYVPFPGEEARTAILAW
jgi:hypothetical protein